MQLIVIPYQTYKYMWISYFIIHVLKKEQQIDKF